MSNLAQNKKAKLLDKGVTQMCWELEADANRISAVLGTRIVGIRTVTLAEPNGGSFDIARVMEATKARDTSSIGQSLKRSAEVAGIAGVDRQYELRIHDYPKPYVSVYERCQRRHIGMFFWSSDTEPLNSGDERMQLLACKLDEYSLGEPSSGGMGKSSGTSDRPAMPKSEDPPMLVLRPSLFKERTSRISRNAPCFCGSGRKYKRCCMRKDIADTTAPKSLRVLSQQGIRTVEQMNITGEADHIIECAENGDARMVLLGRFIFFSTEAGDAWMLEPQERFALCLMQDGEKQPFKIVETPSNFAVEWDAQYHIDGRAFIVTKKSGEVGIRLDYPTEQIVRMTHQE